jgi:hypothetical protein
MTSWDAALDRFEERLASYRSVLDADAEPTVQSWPPDDLIDGGIPAHLRPRANALLAQALRLEAELSAARSALQLPPSHGRRRRPVLSRPRISTEL